VGTLLCLGTHVQGACNEAGGVGYLQVALQLHSQYTLLHHCLTAPLLGVLLPPLPGWRPDPLYPEYAADFFDGGCSVADI